MLLSVSLLSVATCAAGAPQRPATGFWPDYRGGRKVTLLDGEWKYGLHTHGGGDGTCGFVANKLIGDGSYSSSKVKSKEDCCAACSDDGKCAAFTYEPDGTCYLKDNAKVGDDRDGAWSGTQVTIDSMSADLHPDLESWVPNTTKVPMTIDAVAPGYAGPRGVGMYRRTFSQSTSRARLQINACGFYCRIWVGDAGQWTEVGQHIAGGYVGFWLDLPEISAADGASSRELVVLADNRFNKTTAPMHTGGDFWHYGGLMRSVLLHELPEETTPMVWRAHVLPTKEGYKQGEVNITVQWTDASFTGDAPLSLTFDDSSAPAFEGTVPVNNGVSNLQATVPSPRLWTTTDPQLHTVSVLSHDTSSGKNSAGVVERFGLRWWDVDSSSCNFMEGEIVGSDQIHNSSVDSKEACCDACSKNSKCVAFTFEPNGQCFLKDNAEPGKAKAGAVSGLQTARLSLNGQVLKLHGWNHHTQWPDTGASPTDQQLDDDLRQMMAAGTNYIRGAHYPQDQRWLDRLDEHGIVMWEETLGPGVSEANLQDADGFMKIQLQQLDEMMDLSMNHASIMTWGWFNEGPSNKADACVGYQACSEHAHARDPTRFRTWADNKGSGATCLKHASLISLNSYPAWYGGVGDLSKPAAHWNGEAKNVALKHPGKPFVISETGAGGVYEWDNNSTDKQWTQKYQVEVIERDVDVALGNGQISGITLWHYFDFKGNDGATAKCGHCDYLPDVYPPTCAHIDVSCNRPGGENHKGVVDFWRREKQAYSAVAAKYNASIAAARRSIDILV